MKTKMFFISMMLFWGSLSDPPIWGDSNYAMDASMLPAGARAGLLISPLSIQPNLASASPLRYIWEPEDLTWDFDYSPDGRFLVIGGTSTTEDIRLFNAETLEPIGHGLYWYRIHNVTFSPDGETIAGGSLDGRVYLIDRASLGIVSTLPGDSSIPIAWLSPDLSTLATERGDTDISVLHWSDLRGNATQTIRRKRETNDGYAVSLSVGFDSRASTLASANQEGIIHLWDTGSGEHLQKFTQYRTDYDEDNDYCPKEIYEVNVGDRLGGREYWRSEDPDLHPPSPDRYIMIAAYDGPYNATNKDLRKIIHVYETTYEFEPHSNTDCVSSNWLPVDQPVKRLIGHKNTIWNVVYGTEGQEIASASYDDTIRIWDVARGFEKKKFTSHTLRFSNIAFGRDGEVMAVGNIDGTLRLRVGDRWWRPFKAHAGPVTSVAFHPMWQSYSVPLINGESVEVSVTPTLASASTDGTVRFWHLHIETETVRPRTDPWVFYSKPLGSNEDFTRVSSQFDPLIDVGHIVTSVAFSPDSTTFALGSWKGVKVLKLWRPPAGESGPTFYLPTNVESIPFSPLKPVMSVAFSPDGDTLATGCLDGTIVLEDVRLAIWTHPLKILSGHKASVFKVVFSADGRTVASGSDDGTVLLWNHRPAQPAARLLPFTVVESDTSQPDGNSEPVTIPESDTSQPDGDSEPVTIAESDTSEPDGNSEPATDAATPPTLDRSIHLGVPVDATKRPSMVWIDDGAIYALVGAEVERFAPSVDTALNIAIGGTQVYWTEMTGERSGTINAANLDGSGVKQLKAILSVPMGIAVDTANNKLYWTNSRGRIQSLNADGTGRIENVLQDLTSPMDLAVAGGNAYWTQGNGSVRFVNLKGTQDVRNIATGTDAVGSLTSGGGKIYWTERTGESSGTLKSANLNGTDATQLVSIQAVPIGIAVDTAQSKLYWTNSRGRIQSATLTGKNIQTVVDGLESPADMVLINPITAPTTIADRSKYDVDDSGTVDNVDVSLVSSAVGTNTAKYDVNADGKVDDTDIALVRDNRDNGAAAAPMGVGVKLTIEQVDRLQEQIDLLIASGDRSPATRKTLIYLQQLIATARPEKTQLLANYPNPFNPETWIPYELATDTNVKITIYNAQGVVIRTLELGHQSAGYYMGRQRAAYWNGRNALGEPVASGLYFYTLTAGEFTATRRMLIRK